MVFHRKQPSSQNCTKCLFSLNIIRKINFVSLVAEQLLPASHRYLSTNFRRQGKAGTGYVCLRVCWRIITLDVEWRKLKRNPIKFNYFPFPIRYLPFIHTNLTHCLISLMGRLNICGKSKKNCNRNITKYTTNFHLHYK